MAMHESHRAGVTTRLCCECHVKSGSPPADWHPDCMKAYQAKKENAAEAYGPDWEKLVLAVNMKTGEFHAIGGRREPGLGDTAYPAFEVLKSRVSRRPHTLSVRTDITADVQALASRCGVTEDVRLAVGDDGHVYFNPEEMRHWAEEYEATMMALDRDKVPRHDDKGQVYSLYGRICWKTKCERQSP